MKKCPYCAEEIQDEAIKCRYCHSDLTVAPTAGSAPSSPTTPVASAAGASTAPEGAPSTATPADVRYSHTGYRYVLGYGTDYFGIWDRQLPGAAAERFPRTDDGWRQAWMRFSALEPNAVAVSEGQASSGPAPVPTPVQMAQTAPPTTPDPNDTTAVQYTHSGTRYLLGYGRTFFGIWDRQNPGTATERFPRTDDGWAQAWRRYTQIETHFSEVGLPR